MRRWTVLAVIAIAALLVLSACGPSNQQGQPSPTSTPAPSTTGTGSQGGTGGAGGGGGAGGQGQQVFTAVLDSLNQSGVSGAATVTVTPGSNGASPTVRVQVDAKNLVPNQTHAMHIHGFSSGQQSVCPSDTSGSEITTEPVAEQSYGPVIVPLEPFPTAGGDGTLTFDQAVQVPSSMGADLAGRAIVLHGLMVNGAYDPAAPVSCGVLKPATGGAQGGGGSTGGTQSMPATGATGAPSGTTSGTGGSGGLGY